MAAHRHAEESDTELVVRAVQGDRVAFEAIYRRHLPGVYRYLAYAAPTTEDAEELTQETFIKAWQALHQFRREARLGTWLISIAVSRFRMWHRRMRGRRRAVEDLASSARVDGARAPSMESLIDLRRAIAALPARARTVLILHELSEMTHGEIAEAMHITVGASKAQLNRAKRLLREELE